MKLESVLEKLKIVIDEKMEENATDFKDQIAVLMKKDFFQDIYQVVSFDCQDSSGNFNFFLKHQRITRNFFLLFCCHKKL